MAGKSILATHRKAFHVYSIHETYEAGIALLGAEVKSLREGRANLQDSFARVEPSPRGGEVYLYNCHISPYSHCGGHGSPDPVRKRKLLLHRGEIERLLGLTRQRGFTLVPLKFFLSGRGKVKVELALAKGKKSEDKREAVKEREAKREMERALKQKGR
jgi:SsrA-binding protein